jgi:hypothetical protein
MAAYVPSQVCEFLDERVPAAGRGESFYLEPSYAGVLSHLLTMIDGISPHLLTLTGKAAAEFGESTEAIRTTLSVWRSGVHSVSLNPLVGKDGKNPLTFIRKHLGSLADEGASNELENLQFIAEEDLRRALATDIHSMNAALDRGAWKAATVLAGSVTEALLLDALLKREPEAKTAGSGLKTPTGSDLSSWTMHQLTLVADALKIVHTDTVAQCLLAKNFRNLIHPGRSIRLGQFCDRGTAFAGICCGRARDSRLEAREWSVVTRWRPEGGRLVGATNEGAKWND